MSYQDIIHELVADVNPAGVEAFMRFDWPTLCHLPRAVFAEQARLARECERLEPGSLRLMADSMGMGSEYAEWKARLGHAN